MFRPQKLVCLIEIALAKNKRPEIGHDPAGLCFGGQDRRRLQREKNRQQDQNFSHGKSLRRLETVPRRQRPAADPFLAK
jgi:hypothetical protein